MKKLSIFMFLIFPVFIYTQKYNIKFDRISIEEGLSQSTVYKIFQDFKGFMWIGTEDGLNKYNGYDFISYRKENNLTNNRITSIIEERDGILWIGTLNGLNRFNKYENKNKKYFFENISTGKNEITSILKDIKKRLWIGTDNGIFFYNKKKDIFTQSLFNKNINNFLSNKNILKIFEDKKGIIWIGTLRGLNKVEIIDKKINVINIKKKISNNSILSISEDSNSIWIGTSDGLYQLDKNKNINKYVHDPKDTNSLSSNFITSILVDKKNEVWIGTIDGLNKFNRNKNNFYNYKHNYNDPYSISDNSILSLYEDSFGIIWIGTNLGLNKFDNNKINFIHYNNKLSHNNVLSMYESKTGIFWIGTELGLNTFNSKNNSFKQYYINKKQKGSYERSSITTITEDINERLWIGTMSGVKVFNPSTNNTIHFYHIQGKPDSLSDNNIKKIFISKKNKIWIGTENGLNKYISTEKFKKYFSYNSNISSNSIESIIEDKEGCLWVGTMSGLNKLTKNDKFEVYKSDSNNINDNIVLCIFEDKKDRLWIGTKGGLKLFNNNKKFINYKEKHGLPNDDIKSILEDSLGNLWISTNKGLSKFNPENETFKNFFQKDGLQSNSFNKNSSLYSRDKKMYFGGINGFNVYDPKKVSINNSPPKLIITSFKKFNREYKLKKHISNTNEIVLANHDKLISFSFVGLNYSNPKENRYAWKMEGLNNNWIDLEKKRDITITNLTSGSYLLKIKASNCDGIWNENGTSIRLIVPTPYYKTFWFYLLLFILFIFLFIGIFKIKIRAIKKQKIKLESLVKEKTSLLLEANLKLSILAQEDGLTGLTNKRTFMASLDSKCKMAMRDKKPISIIMLDIDYFKIYNDTLGHQAGDNCLKIFAEILKDSIKRPGDLIARYGGEEFIIMLHNTNVEGAIFITKKIKENLKRKNIIFNKTKVPNVKRVTASFGICTFIPTLKFTPPILVLAADTALYQAKEKGRNTVYVFNQDKTV